MIRHRHQNSASRGPRTQVLLALCAAGVVLFNFPLLMVWDSAATVFGLPVLPVALFLVWGALILALALVCERTPRRVGRTHVQIDGGGHGVDEAVSPILPPGEGQHDDGRA